jgi:hypothetical protein
MADTSVKVYDSTMSGAPSLSGTAGALIAVLDACIVNGFGSVTLTGLVVANNVATGTVNSGHGLAMLAGVGPVIHISGASPSALNGVWRIDSVPSSTAFTFATDGIADQTATGTIVVKRAPAGFEKAFSGTNTAAYRSLDVLGTRHYLRVNDSTNAQWAYIYLYESMTSATAGVLAFPPSGLTYLFKSNTADSTARTWEIYADTRCFYMFVNHDGSASGHCVGAMFFGDLASLKEGDAYHSAIVGHATVSATDNCLFIFNDAAAGDRGICRSYTQIGGAVEFSRVAYGSFDAPYPNPANNSLLLSPVFAVEAGGTWRGTMPGWYRAIHAYSALAHKATVLGALGQGRPIRAAQKYAASVTAFDLLGPWR